MMKNMLRIALAVNEVKPGDPGACLAFAKSVLTEANTYDPDMIIFPSDFLTGASCGDISKNAALRDAYKKAETALKNENRKIICDDIICSASDAAVKVFESSLQDMHTVVPEAAKSGVNVIVLRSAQPVKAGSISNWRRTAKLLSGHCRCAVAIVNGGVGESSSPCLYRGFAGIFENGEELEFLVSDSSAFTICADIDLDIIRSREKIQTDEKIVINEKNGIKRNIRKNPFLPKNPNEQTAYIDELFNLQYSALAARMRGTNIQKLVIGVSGGLDSTLALLAAVKAADKLSLPRENVIGISMPGFGTTDRTFNNAAALTETLGAQYREIPIAGSVLRHFEDIGHDPEVHDVTYENAQARERTQILFDVANAENALVAGTGDLTEAALGWSTFGGDHLASYNVNAPVTKTIARLIVKRLAESSVFAGAEDILKDILNTPVSPELIPPDENGAIIQKSEKILGEYELHEFFTWYFVKYAMAPSKILEYAYAAFAGSYSKEHIKNVLKIFIKRHFGSQFKRSCAPDCAGIGALSLSLKDYSIPSDLSCSLFLSELEACED